jgi:hypothetical protein
MSDVKYDIGGGGEEIKQYISAGMLPLYIIINSTERLVNTKWSNSNNMQQTSNERRLFLALNCITVVEAYIA